ncbi:MAG: GIN domain-containing protein [Bacteroidia bacterium]
MNRIISIHIQGLVFQIEEDAFEQLDVYLRKLKSHFKGQEGVEEILSDIESRIAEMLSRNPGTTGAVNLSRVKEIIKQMGDPAQFDQVDEDENPTATYSKTKRVLYRDTENKWLGGVCSGLGAYFDIDTIWIRIAFLFAFFTFGTGFLLYIILWVLIPEAKTPSERLEMKGEKVTIDTIEKKVKEEFDRFRNDFDGGRIADNARSIAGQASKAMVTGLGIGLKIFLRIVGFVMVTAMLALIIAAGFAYFGLVTDQWHTPFFPFFHQLFENTSVALLYGICIALLLLIPVIAILYTGIRLLFGLNSGNRWVGRTLSAMWLFALIGVIFMAFHLTDSWRDHATLSHEQDLQSADTLYIESSNVALYGQKEFTLEFGRSRGIRGIYAMENGFLKRPVSLNILLSNVPKIHLKEQKHANGKSHEQAAELASHISHELKIDSGKLVFNPYFQVPEHDVWKNQQLVYDLYVPAGTVIVFGKNASTFLEEVSTDSYIHNSGLDGKAFLMTPDGLKIDEKTISQQADGESYPYADFDEIKVSGLPDVVLYESTVFSVTTDQNISYTPNFVQSGERLEITVPPSFFGKVHGRIHIGLPKLKRLEVNGGSRVSLRFPNQINTEIELNGSAQLEGEINARNLSLQTNGVNYCNLQGAVSMLQLEITGAGDIDLKKLSCEKIDLESNGGAQAAVRATDHLEVEANGASHVTYYGEPKTKNIEQTGGSSVKMGQD